MPHLHGGIMQCQRQLSRTFARVLKTRQRFETMAGPRAQHVITLIALASVYGPRTSSSRRYLTSFEHR